MDKSVIFAVAGSGKTTRLIEELDLESRVLLLTYTDNNFEHLRRRIIQKFGHFPENITLRTYFSFLHGFCYRPLLQMRLLSRGVNFSMPPVETARFALTNDARFIDKSRRLYHNRLAKFLDVKGCMPEVIGRLERYFDRIFVDEVQDLAGQDFNFLLNLCAANVEFLLVGDFYQHTFDTSRDGAVNKGLHDNIVKYERRFKDRGVSVDRETLLASRRCASAVCDFIRDNLHIDIRPFDDRQTKVYLINSPDDAAALHADSAIVKLFYESHYKYGCHSQNWGASKGLDHFHDVCVVMNGPTWKNLQQGTLHESAAMTRNKLYVACSRARGNVFLVPETLFKRYRV